MKYALFILSLVCVAILAVPTSAQKVTVNYDPTTDFTRYRNYSFLESKKPSSSKLCHRMILDNIQLKLALRGLLPAKPGEKADLLIVYNAGVQELISIKGYDYQYEAGWRRGNDGGYSREYALMEHEQTLVIDLIDPKQNRLIWRGIAEATLVRNSGRTVRNIERVTKKMFAKYPPKQIDTQSKASDY